MQKTAQGKSISEQNVGAILDRTVKLIKQSFHQAFREAGIDLTAEQWVIMDKLAKLGDGQAQQALAGETFKNAPTVSRIIDLLAKKGYLYRKASEHDRREQLIFMTPEGKTLHTRLLPKVIAIREKSWEGLTVDDYRRLEELLNRVYHNLSE